MMKRLSSSDSLNSLLPIYPYSDEQSPRNNHVYSREFQSMLDGLDDEEMGQYSEKKRRLRVDQVKALEKNFEVENKLEPERKVKLAQELGLQPRQVAVWFQNRRARWKTKNLERDFGILKSNYDSLKLDYDSLNHNNQSLIKQIKELKATLREGKTEQTTTAVNSDEEATEQPPPSLSPATKELNYESFTNEIGISIFPDFKDGSSDSDSSAVFNEDNNQNDVVLMPKFACSPSSSPSSMNCFNHTQFVKMEEHNLFNGEEGCDLFSDDQSPATLQWYSVHQWN